MKIKDGHKLKSGQCVTLITKNSYDPDRSEIKNRLACVLGSYDHHVTFFISHDGAWVEKRSFTNVELLNMGIYKKSDITDDNFYGVDVDGVGRTFVDPIHYKKPA